MPIFPRTFTEVEDLSLVQLNKLQCSNVAMLIPFILPKRGLGKARNTDLNTET